MSTTTTNIAQQLARLAQAKADMRESIVAKGVTVPDSATLSDFADYIDAIVSGGVTLFTGTTDTAPDASVGENGDLYLVREV